MDTNEMVKAARAAVKKTINASAKKHLKQMSKEFDAAAKRLGIKPEDYQLAREAAGVK